MDWVYGQAIGFLGNFFALMGNMGVELFELEWVSAIILFFSRLAWALFSVSVVVCAFECGIEYSTGRGNLLGCAGKYRHRCDWYGRGWYCRISSTKHWLDRDIVIIY